MSLDTDRLCVNCKFAILHDYGYSNFTLEGTEFFCSKKKHPADGFDSWYGHDDRMKFAVECDTFQLGETVRIDVDREQLDPRRTELTAEQRAIYDEWDGEATGPSKW